MEYLTFLEQILPYSLTDMHQAYTMLENAGLDDDMDIETEFGGYLYDLRKKGKKINIVQAAQAFINSKTQGK